MPILWSEIDMSGTEISQNVYSEKNGLRNCVLKVLDAHCFGEHHCLFSSDEILLYFFKNLPTHLYDFVQHKPKHCLS